MSKERISWNAKGNWYEACASEGHCSFYFGRDREESCKSFQLFQFEEGKIGEVDISGVLAINVIDLYSNNVMVKGGEGGVYISDKTTEEQRKYLEPYFVNNIPGSVLLRKVLGVKFVDINLNQEEGTFHATMPYGEMKLSFTPGLDGKNPQKLENSPYGIFFSDIKICNNHFWKYNDFGRNWYFKDRSGVIASFDGMGKSNNF